MQRFTDEQLAACADGELGAAEAAAVAEAARADPELARRLARFVETRRVLRETFAGSLEEPVPRRLLDALQAAPAPAALRPWRRRWQPLALAATVVVGIGAAALVLRTGRPPPVTVAGLPPDARALAQALERTPSGVPAAIEVAGKHYEVLPLASVQTASGRYCREFDSTAGSSAPLRAAACRGDDGNWAIVAAAPQALQSGPAEGTQDYQPAGGATPDITAVLGPARRLTPAEEDALLKQGWQAR